ncbi:50S ribosomal protein L11 methyltransferase [Tepidamorphus sp. 3E244]|uniref:50S ribosomal protein L11 methyltransferase n=1 Tax=Tepidamorphus sp. 3E244 TaxID=3385498 RepID=UPI0038FC3218
MYLLRMPATGAADADSIVDLLLALPDPDTSAAAALEIENAWRVDAYYTEEPGEDDIARILNLIDTPEGFERTTEIIALADQDWVLSSLEALPPVAAGRFIVHGRHDRDRVKPNQIGIEIEAGLAFGTGHHGTTKGCLLAISEVLKRGTPANALDVGTGTGILAIAIARAAHAPVLATDIDRDAVTVSLENVRANAAASYVDVVQADGVKMDNVVSRGPYDLIVANILANPLVAMATGIANLSVPGTRLILSGLLTWQGRQVIAAYRNRGFVLVRRYALDGWLTLEMEKH